MTKSVSITITATTEAAARATAQRVINTLNNVATWANTNHPSLVTDITARTQDVTVAVTKSQFIQDVDGNLVIVP
jgi:hypothetical protein